MIALADATAAERHRRIAATFGDRVVGTSDWTVPTPVAGWTARDVVDHLIDWSSALLRGAGIDDVDGAADTDPVRRWQRHREQVQALLDDPDRSTRQVQAGPMPSMPLARLLDAIYTTDVFSHTWDLARATGQDDGLDEEFCAHVLAGSRSMEQAMRDSGQFGPAVAVPPDAGPRDQLVGFLGRDPGWQPPSSG